MIVNTSRFGDINVADDQVVEFSDGILGFSHLKKWCILQGESDVFLWLQSCEEPSTMFVVAMPFVFDPEYNVPLTPQVVRALGWKNASDGFILVICNMHDGFVTGNLQGPLLFNINDGRAMQFIHPTNRQIRCKYNVTVQAAKRGIR